MNFIVFEGLDGAGKSTLIENLKMALLDLGEKVVVTREPGGSELGDRLRELLLRKDIEAPTARAELLLYEAARAQHVEKTILPALARGEWVLCDRYSASSVAFQDGGRGLKSADIEWLNDFATAKLYPALWVLLDLTTDEAERRMKGRDLDRFESENKDFHERVRASYLKLADKDKAGWLVLDASRQPRDLMVELMSKLKTRKLWPNGN